MRTRKKAKKRKLNRPDLPERFQDLSKAIRISDRLFLSPGGGFFQIPVSNRSLEGKMPTGSSRDAPDHFTSYG